ncbi:MAG TPA: hypothetical protein VEK08_19125 [Planctomycetota bacterium]|nr:hypothetical protein [Planctomycetota bacterium]
MSTWATFTQRMQSALCVAVVLACARLCAGDAIAKPRTVTEIVAAEEAGHHDDHKQTAAGQIDAALERFNGYAKAHAHDPAALKQLRAARRRVLDAIMQRARQRVRDAEDGLERARERTEPKSQAT